MTEKFRGEGVAMTETVKMYEATRKARSQSKVDFYTHNKQVAKPHFNELKGDTLWVFIGRENFGNVVVAIAPTEYIPTYDEVRMQTDQEVLNTIRTLSDVKLQCIGHGPRQEMIELWWAHVRML